MEPRRNPYYFDRNYYINGSAVRKLEPEEETVKRNVPKKTAPKRNNAVPKVTPKKTVPARRAPKKVEPVKKTNPKKEKRELKKQQKLMRYQMAFDSDQRRAKPIVMINKSAGFLAMVFTVAVMMVTATYFIKYLDLCAESNRLDKSIAALQTEAELLADANNAKAEAITKDIDLEKIYQTAVRDMGMVFPNHNEVIYYSAADISYVRQYADIPQTATSILDKMIP